MLTIGLTGGIGSGKSAVAECFTALGVKVVYADLASRKVVEPGMPALAAIAEYFGDGILLADGTLDRAALRNRVFADAKARQWLEALLHPLIRAWVSAQLAEASGPYVILESPLLLEKNQRSRVDRVLVVDVPETMQLTRAMARDNNQEAQIRAIMANQLSRQERLALADDVIDNSGSLADLAHQVGRLHQQYVQLAQSHS